MPAAGRWRRKGGIGFGPGLLNTRVERGWLAGTALGAWGKSRRRRRQRLQCGGGRRGGGRRPGDIFERDGAFDLLASEDDLLLPAHKNANIAAVITSC